MPDTRFKPGQSGNPKGRPKGARSRLSEAFLQELAEHWEQNGRDVLDQVRNNDPSTYLRVIASLIPKGISFSGDISYAAIPIPVSERAPLDIETTH